MKKVLILIVLISSLACKKEQKLTTEDSEPISQVDAEVNELFKVMQGSFNSEKQSVTDTTYFNISLHMYPIWSEQGNFLYVEQAMNSTQDKPYRQRIYEIKRKDKNTISSIIYTIPNDSIWIGKWKTPEAFNALDPGSLELRDGCEVNLKKVGENHFKGATKNYTCKSSLRGATYATSEVEITTTKIVSWDRGFDAEGNHVWGAVTGGYVFDKLSD